MALFYDENFGRDRRHMAAKQDVERYRWMLQQELARVSLSKAEAIALWTALSGCNTSHADMLGVLKTSVLSDIKDAAESRPELKTLATTLIALTPCQWLALVDACDRVGAGLYHVDDRPAELRRVGLTAD